MASLDECEHALERLAAMLHDTGTKTDFDRSLSCTVTDLGTVLSGRFDGGSFTDIQQSDTPTGDIKLACSSDDLIALCNNELNVAKAWASGRLKVDASIGDVLKLRKLLA